jgi:hypothetical protein
MISNKVIFIISAILIISLSSFLGGKSRKEYFDTNNEQSIQSIQPEKTQIIVNKSDKEQVVNTKTENYTEYSKKIINGKRLQGSYRVNDLNITFDEYGRPIGQIMSLDKSKKVCDTLGEKCGGFIVQSSDENSNKIIGTFFVEDIGQGFDDSTTFDGIKLTHEDSTNSLTNYQNFSSYVKPASDPSAK